MASWRNKLKEVPIAAGVAILLHQLLLTSAHALIELKDLVHHEPIALALIAFGLGWSLGERKAEKARGLRG